MRMTNLTPHGTEEFVLPTILVRFKLRVRRTWVDVQGRLDTVTIHVEDRWLALVWRGSRVVGLNDPADAAQASVQGV